MRHNVDYSLYLVTDSKLVPPGKQFLGQVEEALRSGVTVIQLREKWLPAGPFIAIAKEVHALARQYNVPLIINDRVDVALAVGAEGVHVGQEDLDVRELRRILGPNKIIGLSVSNADEARAGIATGCVDYFGIGAVFNTQTKQLKKPPFGFSGIQQVLRVLAEEDPQYSIATVAIGGINTANVGRVLFHGSIPGRALNGVAIVSCIMASLDVPKTVRELRAIIAPQSCPAAPPAASSKDAFLSVVPQIAARIFSAPPFVHHITNDVVKQFSANVCIAFGGSPAMSECTDEFADFSRIPRGAVLLNMGTPTTEGVSRFRTAIEAYNAEGHPCVFDPVGAGASELRRNATAEILNLGSFQCVKGNEGEIFVASGYTGRGGMRGVDSVGGATEAEKIAACRQLAVRRRTVALLTGAEDIVAEGWQPSRDEAVNPGSRIIEYRQQPRDTTLLRTFKVRNGHPLMAEITGSGCALGTVVATCLAGAGTEDALSAVLFGLLVYNIAGERAAGRAEVRGPGTFIPAFVDEIYRLRCMCVEGDFNWLRDAKIEEV